jgi:toxin ParE1/3/4
VARVIIWTETTYCGLEEAADYIGNDSPVYAAALVAGAESAAESLAEMSGRGRLAPEFRDPNVRELFVGRYRLIYRISEGAVYILAFIHGARDVAALLGESEGDQPV